MSERRDSESSSDDSESSTPMNNDTNVRNTSDGFYLYQTNEKFLFQRIRNESEVLVIDRITGETVVYDSDGFILDLTRRRRIFGIMGTIKLLAGRYVVVISDMKHVGKIGEHEVWQLAGVKLLPFNKSTRHLTRKQQKLNDLYMEMVLSVFKTPYFYYSYTCDVTNTMQRLMDGSHIPGPPLRENLDKRFLWNKHLLNDFSMIASRNILDTFCVFVIHGFISIKKHMASPGKVFTWTLISRRDVNRAGTRLFRRGADLDGNVANFVETEQILVYKDTCNSFVQVRGSLPFFWQQTPNMRIKPAPVLTPDRNHIEPFVHHVREQTTLYGDVVLVNLIDHKKAEGILERKFKELVERIRHEKIRYEAFDFHRECKNMKYENLNALISKLSREQDAFGYFRVKNAEIISTQTGVFRTNCIDCLDRTNVVQSMFASRNLSLVLQQDGIYENEVARKNDKIFEKMFKNVWADHADIISLQYSGSGALKTDFTRVGRRTYLGVAQDLYNGAVRYFKNNLTDGFRQDSIDLVLGKYEIEPNEGNKMISPLGKGTSLFKKTLFYTLGITIVMMLMILLFSSKYDINTMMNLLFCFLVLGVTSATIRHEGKKLVDFPKLCPDDITASSADAD